MSRRALWASRWKLTTPHEIVSKPRMGFKASDHLQESLWALRAQNRKNVSKRVFLGVCKKVTKKTRKSQKIHIIGVFFDFSGIFGDFFADTFFAILGPEGPETPVNGRSGRDFKIASSGDCQKLHFWCTSNFGTRLGGSLAPKSLVRGDHPNSWKKRSENVGANEFFHVGSRQYRESLRELLRELWFSYCSSRGMPFREWNFEFRELLWEYPGTLLELREWPFHSESVFPEIGVVPRLLK